MLQINLFNDLLNRTKIILKLSKYPLKEICVLLSKEISYYNWVGFYFMNNTRGVLEIGPYAGLKTEHTEIKFGKGICGQVALNGKTFVVENVNDQENYLACSILTKAEIVEPLFYKDHLIGQIDIDSHELNPFNSHDLQFLKNLCTLIAKHPNAFLNYLPE